MNASRAVRSHQVEDLSFLMWIDGARLVYGMRGMPVGAPWGADGIFEISR